MNVQDAANLTIPEGNVRNIHDKNNQLLWSAVGYDVKYRGDTTQQTYSGKNLCNKVYKINNNSMGFYVKDVSKLTTKLMLSFKCSTIAQNGASVYLYRDDGVGDNLGLVGSIDTTSQTGMNSIAITLSQAQLNNVTASSGINLRVYRTGLWSDTAEDDITNAQIEIGETPTTYEPYVGGIPAPNPDYPQDVNVVKGKQTILASGKNLFLIPETETKNGVTLTKNSDGTFNLSGTATATATFNIKLDAMIESGTYTLSKSGGNFIAVVQDYLNTSWLSQLITLNYNVDSVTTSINPVGNRVSFVIQARNGITYNLQNVKIQLEKNSSATQFEVHQNKIVNVDLRGKNLFDNTMEVTAAASSTSSSAIPTGIRVTQAAAATSGSYYWVLYIIGKTADYVGKTLTISASNAIASSTNAPRIGIGICNANGGSAIGISYNDTFPGSASKTFTQSDSDNRPNICLVLYATAGAAAEANSYVDYTNLQAEVGSTATSYVPYYNYELCKIGNYQDYIFKSSGKNLVDAIDSTWQTSNTTLTKTDGIFRMTAASGKIARAALPLTGLIEGETYTISFDALGVSISSNNLTYLRIREESSGGEWISDGVGIYVSSGYVRYSTTFVATSVSDPWAWFYLSASASNTNNVDIYVKNIQLEKGSTATPYEPYGTDWYVHKETGKQTLDNSAITSIASNYTNIEYAKVNKPVGSIIYDNTRGYSNVAIASFATQQVSTSGGYDNSAFIGKYILQAETLQYYVGFPKNTGLGNIQTILNGGIFYCALATPTNTKITDVTLIGQLNAVHDWLRRYDYYGVVSGNLPIIIDRTGII